MQEAGIKPTTFVLKDKLQPAAFNIKTFTKRTF